MPAQRHKQNFDISHERFSAGEHAVLYNALSTMTTVTTKYLLLSFLDSASCCVYNQDFWKYRLTQQFRYLTVLLFFSSATCFGLYLTFFWRDKKF
jgi:hypothetical protein